MVGFLIAVLSGVLMSVQGIFNTQVTKASSIWSANVFVQATALLSCLAVWLAADRSNLFAVFRSEPKYLLLGGVLGAGITWTVIKAMAMLGPARFCLSWWRRSRRRTLWSCLGCSALKKQRGSGERRSDLL